MPSFKVPCPSCEAAVLIKNPNLVGTKVECPKCKYRFKVEEPTADAAAGDKKPDAKDAKKDKKSEKAKDKKAAGGKKKVVPILIAGAAVVLVVVVGYMMFAGGGKKSGGGIVRPNNNSNNGNNGNNGDGTTENPEDKDKEKEKTPPKPSVPVSKVQTTNLLPGQAVAVYRFNMDKVRASTVHGALVDEHVARTFQTSMGFALDEVDTYIHCYTGQNREAFGVIKLKTPVKASDITAKMALVPKPKSVKGRELYTVRSNPFALALGHALSMSALVGDYFERVPMAAPPGAPPQYAVCVYDTQHVIIAEHAALERFLGELTANGYPPYKTELDTSAVPPEVPAAGEPGTGTPPVGMPMTPGGPPPAKAGPGAGTTPLTAPGDPKKPAEPEPKKEPPSDKIYAALDTYRTIEFPLKKALDDMEADRANAPLMVYAEKFDVKQYDPKLLKKDLSLLSAALDPIAARTRYLSGNVVEFSQSRLFANLRVALATREDARELAKEQLVPGLTTVADVTKLLLTSPVEFRDYTQGGATTNPNGGIPGSPTYPGPGGMGPLVGPGGMGPVFGPGGMGPGVGPGVGPGGMGPLVGPGGMGPVFGPGGMGPGGSAGGPPRLPGGTGTFGPGEEGPGTPKPKDKVAAESHIDLGMIDNQLLISIDLNLSSGIYRTAVEPRLVGVANQIKGKIAIFSAEFTVHGTALAGPDAVKVLKAFPRGTADRKSNIERLGLEYPPVQRTSLFVDLLPFMGREPLARSINKNLAWFDKQNLPEPGLDRAGAWVPELLVPYYPQTAWRATSPYAPDHVLGATNYVAVAGVGLDTPRADPNKPEFKTKVGMTGYNWGSKPEEVTDGLSNTIYMLQTPPGLQQPWIAGGGATVRGLDETDPMFAYKYSHPNRANPGTYALMGDGSVRFIPANIDPKVFKGLATRAGGEALADLDLLTERVEDPKAKKPEPKPEPKPVEPDPKPVGKIEAAPPPREKA